MNPQQPHLAAPRAAFLATVRLRFCCLAALALVAGAALLPTPAAAQATQQVTVGTNQPGFSFSVDGATYTTTQIFTWQVGSVHDITASALQNVNGTYGLLSIWNDNLGDNIPLLSAYVLQAGVTSLTAVYTPYYALTINIVGSGTATPTPPGGLYTGIYAYGTAVNLTATPNAGYVFSGWSGSVVAGNTGTAVVMYQPETVTATFVAATAPTATVSPSTLPPFTSVVGQPSVPQIVTLTNSGNTTLNIGSIAITGPNAANFTQAPGSECGATLPSNSSCTIALYFQPTAVATYSASLVLTDSASGSPQTVALTGTGTAVQPGNWTWIGGENTEDTNGTYGVTGTEYIAAPANIPNGRAAPTHWTDASGNIWLFGGTIQDEDDFATNDLWQWNATTKQWAWYGGTYGSPVYGTKGVAAAANIPPTLYGGASWVDTSGNLWFYGGDIPDIGSSITEPNDDMWEYSPATKEWTWQNGDNGVISSGYSSPPVYGTLGKPAAANTPGSRSFAATWTDSSGNFWLFGGTPGHPATYSVVAPASCNDLWEYSPATKQWTWQGGPTTTGQPGVYGTLGTAAAGNVPPSRIYAASWTDSSGNFWLFGGLTYSSSYDPVQQNNVYTGVTYYNDLWEFSPSTMQWTWQGGASSIPSGTSGVAGVYGTLSKPAATNYPGSRADMDAWTDSSGNLWLFGGEGYDSTAAAGELNDLWMFNPSTKQWTWRGGYNTIGGNRIGILTYAPVLGFIGQPGVYGTLGTYAPGNIPGARGASVAWSDSSNNIYLFGGYGFDSTGGAGPMNDLWEYQAPALIAATVNTPKVIVAPASPSIGAAQPLSVGITVGPASGSGVTATPTGSVTLSSGTYHSAATPLASGAATIVVPGGSLATGIDPLTATYTPDTNSSATYNPGTGANVVTVTTKAASTPTVTVTPASSSITTAQSLSVGITVAPASGSGVTATPTGSVTLSSGTYTSAATALVSGAATIVIPAGALAAATDTLTVSYTPDANSSSTFTSATGTNTVTVTGATVQVTVGTSPTGLAFSVDGTAYTTTQTLTWTVGSNHTLATTSQQTSGGTQSTFTAWSDSGAISHAVTAPSSAGTYTASFSTAYQLTTGVSPSGAGSVSPATGSFYAAGSVVNLSATANSGYTFSNWTGGVASSTSAATTITMNAPQSVTANFTAVVATVPVAALTSAISFPSTTQGQTSAAMTATLSNTGNATLNISGIVLGGANAADFALVSSSNPCGSTLAAGASCLIAATFTPQGTATYSATITVTDNSATPTQTTTLSGTGLAAVASDFTLTTTSTAQTVTGGSPVQYTLTVTPSGGAFNGAITFSASGLPAGSTATFAPPMLTPGSSPASSTVTITTVAQYVRNQTPAPWLPPTAVLAALLPLLLWKRRRVAIRTRLALFALAALLGGGVSSLSGCGASGFTLPAVAYTVTLTATSGAITHSTNVTLTVQ